MIKTNKAGLLAIILILPFMLGSGIVPQNNEETRDTHSFNEFIGTWKCTGVNRNMDGTWKTDSTKATWIWFHLFEGNAVQDIFYGGVDPDQVDTASRGGTNIRIYNPDDKKWHMAWFDTNNRKIEVFTAVGDNERIVMEGINAKGRSVRNVFSNISEKHFTWKQYWTFDEGKTWLDVAVIECRRAD